MPGPTYLLIDGENVDATLGMSVLGRRPDPEERPRWDRIMDFAQSLWQGEVKGLFFLNATSGQLPMGFVQALLAMDFHPIPLAGSVTEQVVDIGIQRMLEAIGDSGGNVLLVSHDGDYLTQVEHLLDAGHRVGVIGFTEFVSSQLGGLSSRGLRVFDLEDELGAFQAPLPRVRIIPLASFDPQRYL